MTTLFMFIGSVCFTVALVLELNLKGFYGALATFFIGYGVFTFADTDLSKIIKTLARRFYNVRS